MWVSCPIGSGNNLNEEKLIKIKYNLSLDGRQVMMMNATTNQKKMDSHTAHGHLFAEALPYYQVKMAVIKNALVTRLTRPDRAHAPPHAPC